MSTTLDGMGKRVGEGQGICLQEKRCLRACLCCKLHSSKSKTNGPP